MYDANGMPIALAMGTRPLRGSRDPDPHFDGECFGTFDWQLEYKSMMRGYEPQRDGSESNQIPSNFRRERADGSSPQMSREMRASSNRPFSRIAPVVVPLDGSTSAEHALPHAVAIARRTGAAIWIVHVYSLPRSILRRHDKEQLDRSRKQKQQYLKSVLDRMRPRVDVRLTAIVIESNETAKSLCDVADGAAVVVMATPERGVVGRLLHRSVTEKVLHTLSCPLLLIRGRRSKVDLNVDVTPQHILFPIDGTRVAETIVDSVASLGLLSNAHCTLAHFHGYAPLDRFERAGLRHYLTDAAKRLLPQTSTAIECRDEKIASALLPLAEERNVDLIAFVKRPDSELLWPETRSFATAVARNSTTPILICRQPIGDTPGTMFW
jgi:nucleotide-binding universal stress UspA family protein